MLEAEAQLTNACLNQQKGRVDAQSKLNQADATRRNAELSRQSTDANAASRRRPRTSPSWPTPSPPCVALKRRW
ncbi:MAG TPA: hypothetical protein VK975_01620 [Acidimicrobiales bacterium]|nr:hypothetical protein [Acidimicrobiales bacterium]